MSKLWVFGDSYTAHSEENTEIFWTYKLAKKLKCSKYVNKSEFGAPNQWIFNSFLENQASIDKEDYIIFIITNSDRLWFFEKFPHLSNYNQKNYNLIKNLFGKNQADAINNFQKYVELSHNNKINLQWYYSTLENLKSKYSNLIAIPGFNQNHIDIGIQVKGSLFDVSINEFEGNPYNILEKKWSSIDKRAGHITTGNHDLLAEKILQSIQKNSILDLTDNFNKKFITENNYHLFNNLENKFINHHPI